MQYHKWSGKCNNCGTWNAIEELLYQRGTEKAYINKNALCSVANIGSSNEIEGTSPTTSTKISELDKTLGGGLVAGAAILIAGEPGIGKSTLALQIAVKAAGKSHSTLYVTGEESIEQVQIRARRMQIQSEYAKLTSVNNVDAIIEIIKSQKDLRIIIIDSIQTIYSSSIESACGTVNQVKTVVFELLQYAKSSNISIFFIGHITKDGQIAGPKVIEHMVDTVIYFECASQDQFRIIRTMKNRFGPRGEIGVFEMHSSGLFEVENPSALFMPTHNTKVSGTCLFASMEGSRPILIEVQALVAQAVPGNPRRVAVGWDSGRLAMIIAVLHSRFSLDLSGREIYLNVAGGLKLSEPAADLAVCVALISSARNIFIPRSVIFWGEIGLSGEIRKVVHHEARLIEAQKLGIRTAIVPLQVKNTKECKDYIIELSSVNHILELNGILNDIGEKIGFNKHR